MAEVMLVDIFDNPIGTMPKEEAHARPALHRAFSVFIYDDNGNMLIQRRAAGKYHSGGLWSNACCSHPVGDTPTEVQARARMREELGAECELKEIFSFTYFNRFSDTMAEYEYDHVLLGKMDRAAMLAPSPEELSELKWVPITALAEDVERNPDKYTVWFVASFGRVAEVITHDR